MTVFSGVVLVCLVALCCVRFPYTHDRPQRLILENWEQYKLNHGKTLPVDNFIVIASWDRNWPPQEVLSLFDARPDMDAPLAFSTMKASQLIPYFRRARGLAPDIIEPAASVPDISITERSGSSSDRTLHVAFSAPAAVSVDVWIRAPVRDWTLEAALNVDDEGFYFATFKQDGNPDSKRSWEFDVVVDSTVLLNDAYIRFVACYFPPEDSYLPSIRKQFPEWTTAWLFRMVEVKASLDSV